MRLFKSTLTLFVLIIVFPSHFLTAQNSDSEKADVLYVLNFLKRYFQEDPAWHIAGTEKSRSVFDLIHFIESEPVDSVIKKINTAISEENPQFVVRYPDEVADTGRIPGFVSMNILRQRLNNITIEVQKESVENPLPVPLNILSGIEKKIRLIPPEEGMRLFTDGIYRMPDSLKFLDAVPDKFVQNEKDFQRILRLDSIREAYVELKRIAYNDSIQRSYRDSVIRSYRNIKMEEKANLLKKRVIDSVKVNNYALIREYNDRVIRKVNDSIVAALNYLVHYAAQIDTMQIWIQNLAKKSSDLVLKNGSQHFTRIWLRNEQNDSLSVIIRNIDKQTVMMLIDDGVTFSRFTEKAKKEFDFEQLGRAEAKLQKVDPRYRIYTPWRIGGDGTVGFTQTYLDNWKKGGKSALSLLMVLKGFANYSSTDNRLKWESYGEIRNGWIKPGGEKLQKNDDKFGLGSRFGLSAFKKWYYSTGLDFETQFFYGYKYPDRTTPISGFMSPGKLFFKVGLDYKPSKNLSVFISPFTSKTVFVRDTLHIDQTKFGIDKGKTSFWEPGLNTDIYFKKDLTNDIQYETKYKMFINYREPFTKYDIDWENLFVMRLNDYINMRLMIHLIYDDNVKFKETRTVNGVEEVIWKPKMQVQELITIGFSYKINRQVTRAKDLGSRSKR